MEKPLCIAICEDAAEDTELLLHRLIQNGHTAPPDVYTDGEALLDAFSPGKYDLIFMDIYLDEARMGGLDTTLAIRKRDKEVILAFTTSSTDHALDGYRLGVLKYLEKPVTRQAVEETLSIAWLKRRSQKTIELLCGGKMVELVPGDILFFEMDAPAHAVKIHLKNRVLQTSQSVRLDDVEAMLPPKQFLRCHRGYIVNLQRVKGFDGPDFIMENGAKVYVRLKDERKMKAVYEDYMLDWTRRGTI